MLGEYKQAIDEVELASYFKVGDKVVLDNNSEEIITEIRDYGIFPISTTNWIHVRPSSIKNIPEKYFEEHPELTGKQTDIFDLMED